MVEIRVIAKSWAENGGLYFRAERRKLEEESRCTRFRRGTEGTDRVQQRERYRAIHIEVVGYLVRLSLEYPGE